jgi:hypothetical protein
LDLQLIAPPGRPPGQDGDVPAIRVDVEVIRKQVADGERFHGSNGTDSPLITRTGESALASPRRGMSHPGPPHTFREFVHAAREASPTAVNADPLAAGERKDGNAEEWRNSWSESLECALGHG